MSKIAVWAGVIVIAAVAGNALDSTTTDTSIPSTPATTWVRPTTTTDPYSTTSLPARNGSASGAGSGGVGLGTTGSSGSAKKSPKTTVAYEYDELDCNNWEEYADSGDYDPEDIADICGLDDEELDEYEDE